MKNSIKIYDPRKDEEYIFGPVEGRVFSSLTKNWFVIYCPASYGIFSMEQHILSKVVLASLNSFFGQGFFCVYAVPKEIENALMEDAVFSGVSAIEYFACDNEAFSKRLRLIEKMSYGVCNLGVSKHRFPEIGASIFSDLDDLILFEAPENIQTMFTCLETGETMLITKYFDGIDIYIEELNKTRIEEE